MSKPDSYVEQLTALGPLETKYINTADVKYKLAGLERWKWLWEKLEAMPEGKELLVSVPEGHEAARVAACIRAAIGTQAKTRMWHWSVRRTLDDTGIVIVRGKRWGALRDVLEKQREAALPGIHSSERGVRPDSGSTEESARAATGAAEREYPGATARGGLVDHRRCA